MVVDLRATMLKYVANLFRSESKEFRNDLDQVNKQSLPPLFLRCFFVSRMIRNNIEVHDGLSFLT